ncbi:hypothetical protein Forpi1262_v015570 [Fusarium oxysporum f. sp. raphani]|uniref:Uncharacterized protein n=1 Tax=Fusarium oxysporum f. sp. raphani TaxID=96318 RepID=A0A8J5PNQ6_FUSOX|nr:hypothetical protein Forpi1262_v015570 [Fusarium oxysporum f. sp. raphani]
MKFTLEPPNKAKIFARDARETPAEIVGSNQTLEWRCCFVKVYEVDENGEKRCAAEYDVCNGKGIVPLGTEIHLKGIMGVWKTTGNK